ncbi:MAG: molybdopterin-dependent oxidoreductase [Thermacetogeniaceae bacterium]|nr:molybdopterin-dependent oxidoreductase [Syntrophomonadaceae bacterium]
MLIKNYSEANCSVKTFCRMCSYRCPIVVYIEQGKIKKITGDKDHPVTKGRLCVKGSAILDLVYSPARLLKPLKKVGERWQEIDLEIALQEISQKILSIKEKYGAKSIGVWKGESLDPTQSDICRRFAFAFGTPNIFSNDTVCAVSKQAAIKSVIGGYPTPDFQAAKCIVVWGANPRASHFPLYNEIKDARKRGAKVLLIDPRKSSFAKIADLYFPIKPGTDGALAWGIINIIIENKWYDQAFVEEHTIGFEELAQYARKFNLRYVAEETGISQDDIYKISKTIAESAPHVTYRVGVGPEQHDNGFNNIRAIACIGALCGCTDRPGGDRLEEPPALNSLVADVRGNVEKEKPIGAEEYPVFYDHRWEGRSIKAMDAMLENDPYPLRGLILTGANPVITNPNSDKVEKALKSLDLFVVRDLFMTETAKLADYVLPAASFLERSELIRGVMPQTISLTKKVLEFDSCQNEYQFWSSLAKKVGIGQHFPWKDEDELNRWIIEPLGLSLEELAQKAEGYIYKAYNYEKFYKNGFNTPSGKVEFTSDYLAKYGYEKLPVYRPAHYLSGKNKAHYKFILITGAREARFNNSCYHNIPRLKKAVPMPLLEIHPADAANLQLADGDLVEVTSAKGSLNIRVSIVEQDEILRGFLQITHGFDEVNVNRITPDDILDPVIGFPALKSVPVNVTKIPEDAGCHQL